MNLRSENVKPCKKESRNPFVVGIQTFFRGKTWNGIKHHPMLYAFVLPAVVLIAVFCYGPMFGLVIAFQDFQLSEGVFESEFVGFQTFYDILFDYNRASYLEFRNTVYISLIRIVTNFPVILIFTLLVNEIKSKRAKSTVQAIAYIPYFISWISIGGMSYNLFAVDGGLFNKIREVFGLEPITWYSEPKYWWGILTVSSLWKGMGWSTLIYLSSLGAIDEELYDACTIDGGGRFRKMVTVTLPGISSVIMLQLILDVGGLVTDNYDQVMAMVNGSQSLHEVIAIVGGLEFEAIQGGSRYSRATSYGLIRGLIGLVLVLGANKIAKKTDNEGIL